MVRVPTHRPPTHPAEMLREEFLLPMDITQEALASALYLSYEQLEPILSGARAITPAIALRLARFLGTSAGFWLNLQMRWDLFQAQEHEYDAIQQIQPYARYAHD